MVYIASKAPPRSAIRLVSTLRVWLDAAGALAGELLNAMFNAPPRKRALNRDKGHQVSGLSRSEGDFIGLTPSVTCAPGMSGEIPLKIQGSPRKSRRTPAAMRELQFHRDLTCLDSSSDMLPLDQDIAFKMPSMNITRPIKCVLPRYRRGGKPFHLKTRLLLYTDKERSWLSALRWA